MTESYDVIIVGAALNGLATALALGGGNVRRPLKTLVVDAKNPETFDTTSFDGRASAMTDAAQRLFEALDVWREIAPHAQPMNEIIVTDARNALQPRPTLLHFGEGDGARPRAQMIENRFMYAALFKAAQSSPNISFATGVPVSGYDFGPGLAKIRRADGSEFRASLIVAADGRKSPAREAAHIHMRGWDYDQTGIVVTVSHELPHNGRAEEHFTPDGPFAILPLPSNYSSLVWAESRANAERILALPDEKFHAHLMTKFGTHLGAVKVVSGRHGYPLALYVAEQFHATRLALVGDAGHCLHPLAGLGFNLGLRDVAALAECVHDAAALGFDIGGTATLERYTVWRRFDTVMTAAAMDGLNRLFANDNQALKLVRDMGLRMVNRMKGLKAGFVREANGLGGDVPKLLRGERI